MPTLAAKHIDTLMSNPWFAALSDSIRQDLIALARQRMLGEGKYLFRRGDKPDGLYVVLEGSVRVSGTSEDGREAILNIYEPGVWLGEVSTLGGSPRVFDAHAHTPTIALQVSAEAMEVLLDRYPQLTRLLLRQACLRLREMMEAFEAFSTQTLEQRFAARLLALSISFGTGSAQGRRIELRLSQETLAQLVGATRQRVNQLLKGWEAEGLIEQSYGRILVRNPEALRRLTQVS